jgi:hypothetical protein
MTHAFALQEYLDFAYIIAVVLFMLSLKWLSSPATARWGVLAGEIGAVLAVGEDDGGAATNCLKPCLWRGVGGHDRYCRVLREHVALDPF